MRKLFSLLATVLFAGSMMAETVTLTMEDFAATEFTYGGISVATAKNDGQTNPAYNATGKDLRVYAKGSITITADQNITGISFAISAQGKKRLAPVTANVGEVAVAGDPDFTVVWSGSASEVILTVGEKADYGTEGSAKAGQLDFTAIEITLDGEITPPAPVAEYYIVGSMTEWQVNEDFKMAANPAVAGEYMFNITLAATDQFKVVGVLEENQTWYPDGMGNNYGENGEIVEEGAYTVYFRPAADGGENWFYGCIMAEYHAPMAEPTDCATAAAAALSVENNNDLYNDGAVYTIEGYVTGIKTAYSDQYHNISFWMADAVDGGEVLQAYRAACASEADAPAVGDKVAVTGSLTKYNTTPEFAAGATFVITEPAAPADTYTVAGEPAEVFGSYWDPADTNNDMVLNEEGLYYWEKRIQLTAGTTIAFKVVKNHSWDIASYPADNVTATVEEDGEYIFPIAFQLENQQIFAALHKVEEPAAPTNCAEAAEAALSVENNNDLYNDGAVYTIEGYVTGIKTAYSDQYHNISFWMADTQDGGEVLQAYRAACASEADAPAVGDKVAVTGSLTKYNTTPEFAAGCTFVITEPATPVEPEIEYYVCGSMTSWAVNADYKLVANPVNAGEYMGDFTFEANAEFKVVSSIDGFNVVDWFPTGMENNYQITEAGDYTVYFRPEGGVEGWYEGYFNVVERVAPAGPTNCAEAAEAALSVENNNDLYNDGAVYTIEGYVTAIQSAYNAQYGNVSFWMADAVDGGNVLEAYRAVCASAEDAPNVGDKVAVTGSLTKYNTTPEFAAGCTFVILERAEVVEPQNLGEKTIAEFLELANMVDTCVLTGIVDNIVNTTYGNFDLVEIDNAEVKVFIYGLLTADGQSKQFANLGIAEGDTLTLKAVYSLYNNAPQVKNAVFVSVAKKPVEPGEIIDVVATDVRWTDATASQGWWQIYGMFGEYDFSISNISAASAPGTYAMATDLDEDWTYLKKYDESGDVVDSVKFVGGEVVVAISAEGVVTVVGALIGNDGNTYNFNLTYSDPVAEHTVNIVISEWQVASDYLAYGIFAIAGEAANGDYVQLDLATDNGIAGDYTEDDEDPYGLYGSGLIVGGEQQSIFSFNARIEELGDGAISVTADILCYNNTMYHVTTAAQGIDGVNAALKAVKKLVNGQVFVEKAGKTYNMNGAVVR